MESVELVRRRLILCPDEPHPLVVSFGPDAEVVVSGKPPDAPRYSPGDHLEVDVCGPADEHVAIRMGSGPLRVDVSPRLSVVARTKGGEVLYGRAAAGRTEPGSSGQSENALTEITFASDEDDYGLIFEPLAEELRMPRGEVARLFVTGPPDETLEIVPWKGGCVIWPAPKLHIRVFDGGGRLFDLEPLWR